MGSVPVFPKDPYGGAYGASPQMAVQVDELVGSAYDVVRYVAENLEYIKHVSSHLKQIYRVYQSIEGIDQIYIRIEDFDKLIAELDNIIIVAGSIESIITVAGGIEAVEAVADELPALIAIYENLEAILTHGPSAVIVSDVPPPTPLIQGHLWWNSVNGNLYTWYRDPDQTENQGQFVQINTASPNAIDSRRASVTPFEFGGAGDGVIDDTMAVNNAIQYLHDNFRGGEVDMSGGRWLIDSAEISMRHGVYLVGSWRNNGAISSVDTPVRDTSLWRSVIILNPAYTIRHMYDGCGVEGMAILRKGLTVPTDVRTSVDGVGQFAGTAITFGDGTNSNVGDDCYIGHCFIMGFEYAVHSMKSGRLVIEHVKGDNLNGIWLDNSLSIQHLSHCHFRPFFTYGSIASASYAVSGAVNNGSGLIRLTVAANVLVTGDTVVVFGVGGVTAANGRFIATVVDATHIDLQGSVFAGTYTSGGNVHLSAGRRNKGFWFSDTVDWGQADHCLTYDYDVGFDIANSDHCELLNCGTDGSTSVVPDPTNIGMRLTNCKSPKLVGCRTAGTGTGVVLDVGAGETAVLTGHDAWGTRLTGISVLSGYAVITSTTLLNTAVGISVANTSDGIFASANKALAAVTTPLVIGGVALRKSMIGPNSWVDATVGQHRNYTSAQKSYFEADWSNTSLGPVLVHRKARGTPDLPLAAASGDNGFGMRAEFWDGVDTFQVGASYRVETTSITSATNAAARHVWAATQTGAVTPVDRAILTAAAFAPISDDGLTLGSNTLKWTYVAANRLNLLDGQAAPAPVVGIAQIYVDTADGDLKVKFGDGVVKTLAVDT